MTLNTVTKPLVILAIAILLAIFPIIGCNNGQNGKLSVQEVKYTLVTFDTDQNALVIAWTTNKVSQGRIIDCTTDGVCESSDIESTSGALHLFVCSTVPKIKTYTIVVTTPEGEEASYFFNNPLTNQ